MNLGNAYVQFSKVVVVIVIISVTALAAFALGGMIFMGDFAQCGSMFAHYTDFAAIVFVAYSGNSVEEKWLVSGSSPGKSDKGSAGSVG